MIFQYGEFAIYYSDGDLRIICMKSLLWALPREKVLDHV